MASRTTAIPQRVYPTGMLMALGAISMYFAALISAWVVREGLGPARSEAPVELPRRLLEASGAILVASSVLVQIARRKLHAGLVDSFRTFWLVGIALGLLFLGGQAAVWERLRSEGFFLATNPDSSFFYLFAASHAIHLIGGIVGLGWVVLRPLGRLAVVTAARVGAMYWHFLTLIWLVILALLFGVRR